MGWGIGGEQVSGDYSDTNFGQSCQTKWEHRVPDHCATSLAQSDCSHLHGCDQIFIIIVAPGPLFYHANCRGGAWRGLRPISHRACPVHDGRRVFRTREMRGGRSKKKNSHITNTTRQSTLCTRGFGAAKDLCQQLAAQSVHSHCTLCARPTQHSCIVSLFSSLRVIYGCMIYSIQRGRRENNRGTELNNFFTSLGSKSTWSAGSSQVAAVIWQVGGTDVNFQKGQGGREKLESSTLRNGCVTLRFWRQFCPCASGTGAVTAAVWNRFERADQSKFRWSVIGLAVCACVYGRFSCSTCDSDVKKKKKSSKWLTVGIEVRGFRTPKLSWNTFGVSMTVPVVSVDFERW